MSLTAGRLPFRPLGPSPDSVSCLAFGAFKIGRNTGTKYDTSYELPDDATCETLLNQVLDWGINLIDTAPAYGISEERIGQFLAHRRSEFLLSTKVGETFSEGVSTYDYSKDSVLASVERSLQRLRTDHVDLLLIHSNGADLEILQRTELVETLLSLRDQGIARRIGMSGKTPAGAAASLEWADAVMVEYHLRDQSHADVIDQAHQANIAVLVKKGLASGHLPAADAIQFVLQNPSVSSLVIGGLSLANMQHNIAAATGAQRAFPGN